MRRPLIAVTCALALAGAAVRSARAVESNLAEQQPPHDNTNIEMIENTVERQKFVTSSSFIYFHGLISNETMHQNGEFSVVIGKQKPSDLIIVRVHAWDGLLGAGELSGTLSKDGHLFVSGQMLMGSNIFTCDLTGIIEGSKLTGSAKFVHNANGNTAYSYFKLTKF